MLMTNKKQRTRKARTLRRIIKGVTLPQSIRLVRAMSNEVQFIDSLRSFGFSLEYVVTGHCPSDGGPEGYYAVSKNNVPAGKIPFNCCGAYIEEVKTCKET